MSEPDRHRWVAEVVERLLLALPAIKALLANIREHRKLTMQQLFRLAGMLAWIATGIVPSQAIESRRRRGQTSKDDEVDQTYVDLELALIRDKIDALRKSIGGSHDK